MAKPIDKKYLIESLKSFDEKILDEKYLKNGDIVEQHTHDNKDILDKFSESVDGKILYNGKQIEGTISFDFIEYTDEEIESGVKQILGLS